MFSDFHIVWSFQPKWRNLLVIFVLLNGSISLSQETFSSEKFSFKITFPDIYKEKEKATSSGQMITLTCQDDISVAVHAYTTDTIIPKDNYSTLVAASAVQISDNLRSKFKKGKILAWSPFEGATGIKFPIKGKAKGADGNTFKFWGNGYICMIDNIEYHIIVLGASKNSFNFKIENEIINSFKKI